MPEKFGSSNHSIDMGKRTRLDSREPRGRRNSRSTSNNKRRRSGSRRRATKRGRSMEKQRTADVRYKDAERASSPKRGYTRQDNWYAKQTTPQARNEQEPPWRSYHRDSYNYNQPSASSSHYERRVDLPHHQHRSKPETLKKTAKGQGQEHSEKIEDS